MNIQEELQHIFSLNNSQFLISLYRQLLNREPDHGGFQAHLKALNSGVTRWVIFTNFLESNEFGSLLSQEKKITKNPNEQNTIVQVLYASIKKEGNDFVKDIFLKIFNIEPTESDYWQYNKLTLLVNHKVQFIIKCLTNKKVYRIIYKKNTISKFYRGSNKEVVTVEKVLQEISKVI